MAFIREYAMAGDPGVPLKVKKPSHTPAKAAKATTHPRSKAAKRATRVQGPSKAKTFIDTLGANLPGGVGAAFQSIGVQDYSKAGARLAGIGGGFRRKRNFANVRALRRAIGRLEGFERIVKSVEKAYPRIRRATHHYSAGGHRAGCRCAVCKRRS